MQDFWVDGSYNEGLLTNLPRLHFVALSFEILCKKMNFHNFCVKIFLVYGHFVLVPAGYTRILLFLRKQNKRVAGSHEY